MLRIFIGWDAREVEAYHVLAHSIITRASIPVSIAPVARHTMPGLMAPRGPLDSTDFSRSRFLVPYLSDYIGTSVFMDCDMLCLGDVAELAGCAWWEEGDVEPAVWCVKHPPYQPKESTKF